MQDERRDFYVYMLMRPAKLPGWDTRPVDEVRNAPGYLPMAPFYVGKGSGYRVHVHSLESDNSRGPKKRVCGKVVRLEGRVPFVILFDGATETEAYSEEIRHISIWGRRDIRSGILWNLNDGGGSNSNYSPTKLQRKRHKEAILEFSADTERLESKKAKAREVLLRPDVQRKITEGRDKWLASPEFKEVNAQSRKKMASAPGYKERHKAGIKAATSRPEWRENVTAANRSRRQNEMRGKIDTVSEVRTLRNSGMTLSGVAKATGYSIGSVHRLCSPKYDYLFDAATEPAEIAAAA